MKTKLSFYLLSAFVLMIITQSCLKDSSLRVEEVSRIGETALSCNLPEDCNGGIELLQLYPEVENYFFNVSVYKISQSVTVNSFVEFENLSDDQKCHVITYRDYSSGVGFNNPYIDFSFVANLPYYENERYWFVGQLLPNGGQMPTPNDFIRIKLYHPNSGNDCMDIYDSNITNTILSWDTGSCEDTNQTNNCRHRN